MKTRVATLRKANEWGDNPK